MKKGVLILIFLAAATKSAAGTLFYGGGNLGFADKSSSHNTCYGLHAGIGIIPFVGIEAGIWDFGSLDGADHTAFYLAAKPNITIDSLHLYVKAGLDLYDVKGDESDDGIEIMFGAGVEYFLSRIISIGASVTRFGFDDDNISNLNISATVHFP
ncbi:MAG: hypothetical protein CR981_00470 [Proteobacteria bacterium]|nr:MAG: hypothetical protein CR981_00470 [Pseudomonadota bacterium]PIE65194.1 MAG: hypothetical protein CSA26_05000 [Desulfobacterales bacterium]